jgi:predicted HTH domain antitoxin
MTPIHVQFDLPAKLALQAGLVQSTVNQEARKILALFLYEHKRISLGKACELGGMSYWEVAEKNRELGIPVVYSEDDLQTDLGRLTNV